MKRLLIGIMVLMFSALTGCSFFSTENTSGSNVTNLAESIEPSAENTFSLTEKNMVENMLVYQIKQISASKRIDPPIPGNSYTYYEAKGKGNLYLDLTMIVTNTGNETITADKLATINYRINNNTYHAVSIIEEDEGENFTYSSNISITPMKSCILHFLSEIPEEALNSYEIKTEITIKGILYSRSFLLSDVTPDKQYLAKGDAAAKENYAKITIKSMKYASQLVPDNKKNKYTYYKVDDSSHIYLILKIKAKNLKSTELEADKIITMRVTYKNNSESNSEEYNSFSTIENAKGTAFQYTSSETIRPLGVSTIYYLAEVPKKLSAKEGEIYINLAGDKYYITMPPAEN